MASPMPFGWEFIFICLMVIEKYILMYLSYFSYQYITFKICLSVFMFFCLYVHYMYVTFTLSFYVYTL